MILKVFAVLVLFIMGAAFFLINPFNEKEKVIPRYCNGVPFSECETQLSNYGERTNYSTCKQECLNVKNDDTCKIDATLNPSAYSTWKECMDTTLDHRACFNECRRTDGSRYNLSYPNHEKTGAYCNVAMKHWCTNYTPLAECESRCYDFGSLDLCYGNDDYDLVSDCFFDDSGGDIKGVECITGGLCKTFNNENYKRTFS